MKTPKEIIDKYFPSGLHEDPEQSELHKIFIFNAMEEYASQFKSKSEVVGGVIAMYDFLLEENCELREKLKRYEH